MFITYRQTVIHTVEVNLPDGLDPFSGEVEEYVTGDVKSVNYSVVDFEVVEIQRD